MRIQPVVTLSEIIGGLSRIPAILGRIVLFLFAVAMISLLVIFPMGSSGQVWIASHCKDIIAMGIFIFLFYAIPIGGLLALVMWIFTGKT